MGPLKGFRIIEFAGIGPAPFAGMLLSDMGAEVIRIERKSSAAASAWDVTTRGRKSIAINLKDAKGVELALKLIATADALTEGFRPGVMEKLGLGPDVCLAMNPRLVYGRMTGWGQYGPLAQNAGHDINYLAITGALAAIGREEGGPVPPLNLVGDFGGGGTYLVIGILAALLETKNSGKGQVIDAAISDGVSSLMTMMHGLHAVGGWDKRPQQNILDGGSHYYDSYECADGKWIALGAVEPQFYQTLVDKLGVDIGEFKPLDQFDKQKWVALKPVFSARIKEKTQAEWCEIFAGSDACFAPVLDIAEAMTYPHNVERNVFVEVDGIKQSAPAPRFSRTPSTIQSGPVRAGNDNEAVFTALGLSADEINAYTAAGIIS
jgi:alpha-methylacyl-CoA racemase